MEQVNRSGRRTGLLRTAWTIIGVLAGMAGTCAAQVSGHVSEYEVKAAYLLNFTRFVTWPAAAFADAGSRFAICILGSDPFEGALQQVVAGETVDSRRIVIERLKAPPRPKSCQILFMGDSEKEAPAILEGLGPGVLTVGERPGFLRAGGIIRFTVEDRHVRFDINQRAAVNASLTLSARLLSVARSVRRGGN